LILNAKKSMQSPRAAWFSACALLALASADFGLRQIPNAMPFLKAMVAVVLWVAGTASGACVAGVAYYFRRTAFFLKWAVAMLLIACAYVVSAYLMPSDQRPYEMSPWPAGAAETPNHCVDPTASGLVAPGERLSPAVDHARRSTTTHQ
jgi:hypothetical protein